MEGKARQINNLTIRFSRLSGKWKVCVKQIGGIGENTLEEFATEQAAVEWATNTKDYVAKKSGGRKR